MLIDFYDRGSNEMTKKKKVLLIILVIVIAALACAVGLIVYASSHASVTVNGVAAAGLSDEELAEKIAAEEEKREVSLLENGQAELTGTLADYGYTVDRDTLASKISAAVKQQKENPLELLKSLGGSLAVTVDPDWTVDEDTFADFVKSESFSTARRSTRQAGVVYDEASAAYVASGYDAGNEIDDTKLQSVVKEAIDQQLGSSVEEKTGSVTSGSAEGSDAVVSASGDETSGSSDETSGTTDETSGSSEATSDTAAVTSGSAAVSSGSDEGGAATAPSEVQVEDKNGAIEITIPSSVYIVAAEEDSSLTEEELQNEAEMMNKYAGAKINYTFGSETVTLDFDTISQWISYSDGQLTFDDAAMKQYISEMADKYNTRSRTRTFTTTAGTQITFDGSDNEYGYRIDQDAELTQMKADIESGQEVTREPCYVSKNSYGNPLYLKRNGTDDLAGTYVEVDLTKQHLWFYKDGQLIVESDIVSGLPTSERETKTGVFPLAYKKSPANLSSDVNGYSVDVSYWMPFFEGQGLHDATWRSSFGGSIYKTDGSHGCVNLPKDVAATIYNNIDAGTAIVIYKS
jgi:hypothetical protein